MPKFICTLFERASLPEGRVQRRRAGITFALSVTASLWSVIWLTLSLGSSALDQCVSLSIPRSILLYCLVLGVGAGSAHYLAMSWWRRWTTRAHAAWLGVLTVGLVTCLSMLVSSLVSDFVGVVAGAWSLTMFSVLFAKDTQGERSL